MSKPLLIGIAGGTGSGKTLIAKTLVDHLNDDRVVLIQLDAYYKDLSLLTFKERAAQNFDHPDAIDEDLLVAQIQDLLAGKSIERPIYDFTNHLRKKETVHLGGHKAIILEGILALQFESLRDLLDIKVYVETEPDVRLIRRLKRDLLERGRSVESVLQQYEDSVRPMHLQFVEPTKKHANIIIPGVGKNIGAIDLLQTKIEAILQPKV